MTSFVSTERQARSYILSDLPPIGVDGFSQWLNKLPGNQPDEKATVSALVKAACKLKKMSFCSFKIARVDSN